MPMRAGEKELPYYTMPHHTIPSYTILYYTIITATTTGLSDRRAREKERQPNSLASVEYLFL